MNDRADKEPKERDKKENRNQPDVRQTAANREPDGPRDRQSQNDESRNREREKDENSIYEE